MDGVGRVGWVFLCKVIFVSNPTTVSINLRLKLRLGLGFDNNFLRKEYLHLVIAKLSPSPSQSKELSVLQQ